MLATLFLLDAGIVLLLLVLLSRRRQGSGALPFFGLLAAVFLYNLGYGLELLTPPGTWSVFWNHLQYWGIALLPGFWLWLAWETPFHATLRSRWALMGLFAVPAVTLALNLTNDFHHWYYVSLEFVRVGDETRALIEKGPWYLVHVAYSIGVFFVSLVLFAVRWRRLERGFGSMVTGLLGGTGFIWAAAGAYQLGWVPGNVDLTPLGLTLTSLTYYFVLWPSRLYEMVPLSREVLFQTLPEPVVVTDKKARLVDWNAAAVTLFPALEQAHTGWPLSRVVTDRAWLETLSDPQFSQAVTLDRGGVSPGWWSITPAPVRDSGGRIQGGVVMFRDVSALVARHEIHEPLDATDLVTGLFQEATFRQRATTQVTRCVRRGESVALVLFAFPTLVEVSQTWGEGVVSSWRKQLAHQFLPLLRPHDLVGSLEGGGFAVLMPGLNAAKAQAVSANLLASFLSSGLHLEGLPTTLKVQTSTAAVGRNQSARLDDLWREAAAALEQVLNPPGAPS